MLSFLMLFLMLKPSFKLTRNFNPDLTIILVSARSSQKRRSNSTEWLLWKMKAVPYHSVTVSTVSTERSFSMEFPSNESISGLFHFPEMVIHFCSFCSF